jgi:PAS domain S-box-containing protein
MRDSQAIPPTAPAPLEPIAKPHTHPRQQHFRGSAETTGAARPLRAGAALREIEARMTAIVNTAVDGMLTIDEKGTIEWLNPAAQAAFGYAADELIGQNVKVLMPPAYHAAHDAGLRNYLETGERRVIGRGREAVGLRKDGSTFPVDLSVSEVVPAEPGGRRIFLGIVRDITQRKLAEQEIDQTGDLLRAVADGTTDAVFVKDRQGKYLLFNEAAARFVGHPAAEVIGKDDTALFDPDSARMLIAQDRQVMERGRVNTAEENLSVSGVTRVYMATKAPYRDRQGSVIGLIGIARDITEFKKAEELRAAKEAAEAVSEKMRRLNQGLERRVSELEALFNIVPIGIGIADDPECRHMRANRAFAELLGIPQGANASKSAPEGEQPNFTCQRNGRELAPEELPMQVTAVTGTALTNVELDLVRADGRVVKVLGNTAPLFDEHGKPRGSIGAFWDIGDLKKAEEQMRAAKEAAEEANKAKDDFLATITHELRTPMGAVLLWSKMLRAGQLDEEKSRAAIENIVRCAEDQSRLVNDLLDASQAFHGKMGVEENPVELADVLGSAVDAFTPAAHSKGVALDADCCQAVVTGDPTRLRQVVSNLLSNAVKFTHAGGRVHVALTRDESHARLEITDTGGGISPEFLPHLFDRFTQADTSTTRKHGGLGLGLSIVRHIVELHGGTVQAKSEGTGHGAQFIVTLPLAK